MDGDVPKTTPVSKGPEISWEQRFVDKRHAKDNIKRPVEELFWQDIQGISLNVLQKANKSGFVAKSDLGKSIQSGNLKGDEAQVAAALYRNFERIKGDDFTLLGAPRLSNKDIASFTKRCITSEKEFRKIDDLSYWAKDQGNLKRFSKDGSMSLPDIITAQKQANLSAEDRAMLAELNANFKSISSPAGKIGKAEINSYYKRYDKTTDSKLIDAFQEDMALVEDTQQTPQAHKLYGSDDPLKSINADAVKQGFANDCAFKSALAGLANARPRDVLAMIHEKGSGFEVQLPGVGGKLAVSKPTDEELGLYSGAKNKDGFWPTVLTKAYGESVYNQANQQEKSKLNSVTTDEWAVNAGDQAAAIRALTGHQVKQDLLKNISDNDLVQQLQNGYRDKRVMLLITAPSDSKKTVDGFRTEHALTVTNVGNENGKFTVTVRDPQDNGKNRPDGTMQVSLDTLKKNFYAYSFETNKPL